MKKKRSNIIITILSLGIITILVYLNPQSNSPTITSSGTLDPDIELFIEQNGLAPQSIVYTADIFVESDQNEFEKFLDEEKPLGKTATPTFTLETSATLIDQNGNEVSKSSFLNIPILQSLTDTQGNVLIGSAQVGFFGKTTEDAEIDVIGTVEFWLDTELVATKKIFIKPDGLPKKTHSLFLDDQIKNTIINQVPKAFTYKFTDEGFEDLSTHTFRVILKDFGVETIAQNERKKYSWSGEYLAYQLQMTVDKSKISIVDENNKPISVFKDDGKLIVCDVLTEGKKPATNVPPITVIRKTDNQIIATIDVTKTGVSGIDYKDGCAIFSGLQRSTEYLFHMEGRVYEVTTPRIQQNIYASCSSLIDSTRSPANNPITVYVGDKCVSTFAKEWDYIYHAKSGQKVRINSISFIVCGVDISQYKETLYNGGRNVWASNSPTFKSPEVEVFDGQTSLGKIGGKTYCNSIDNLPKGKELTVKINRLDETGERLGPHNYYWKYCQQRYANFPFEGAMLVITTPTDTFKEFSLKYQAKWNGIYENCVTVINSNISNKYQEGGWGLTGSGIEDQSGNPQYVRGI